MRGLLYIFYFVCYDLDNSSLCLIAFDLPVRNELIKRFQNEQCRTCIKDACAKLDIRFLMVKQYFCLIIADANLKIIAHNQDDINIVGRSFSGYVAAKDYKSLQFACSQC